MTTVMGVFRISLVYLFPFFLRAALKGDAALGISDMLVQVLIADATQNAMANQGVCVLTRAGWTPLHHARLRGHPGTR